MRVLRREWDEPHHPVCHRLLTRIAATDRLPVLADGPGIDLIVYRLYGLTGEEVAVVEG